MGAPLRPVSFAKARGHMPRLSAPYVPGVRHERYWIAAECEVVRKHYAAGGAAACKPHLPRRSTEQIMAKAHALGVKRKGRAARIVGVHGYKGIDADIRAAWPALKGRGAFSELARRLGVPRWWLSKRMTKLGLTMPHKKEPDWTAAEIRLINWVPLHDPHRCAEIFKEHGFQRTPTSIVVKSKRLALPRRYGETFSATSAARVLGVDAKNFSLWIRKGWLEATKRATRRLPQQGGDPWSIERRVLRQCVIDNLERIDLRKVDKFAFVDLLVADLSAPASRPASRKKAAA